MEKYVSLKILGKITGDISKELDKQENQVSLIPTEEASKLIKKVYEIAESAAVDVEEE